MPAARPGANPRPQIFDSFRFASSPYLPFSREIPLMYNESYVRVMPRDPGHIFAFWERGGAPGSKAAEPASADPAPKQYRQVLRVYEVVRSRRGEQAARFVGDIPLEKKVYSQYIRIPQSGGTYRVEIGECDLSGRFTAWVASNDVAMPDARIHEEAPHRSMRADTAKLVEISARSATVSPVRSGTADGSDILSVEPEKASSCAAPAGGSLFMSHPGSADIPLPNNGGGSGQPQ
jgi:hypothetical protein